jgi:hypothetical protein
MSDPERAHVAETLAAVRPVLDRLWRREWRVLITGATNARERDAASLFQARPLELLDSMVQR